jgi:hypothetical protein
LWRPNYFGISSAAADSTSLGLLAVIGAPDIPVVSCTVIVPAVAGGVPAVAIVTLLMMPPLLLLTSLLPPVFPTFMVSQMLLA